MLRLADAALLALGLLRGLMLLHEPLVGLANNYDMIRVQACIDAYPMRVPLYPLEANSWQAPVERYAFHDGVQAPCFHGPESWLAITARPLLQWTVDASGGFPLRAHGVVKFALLALLALAATLPLLRRGRGETALSTAACFALLLFDPGVTIYLNGFYAEYSTVLWGSAAVLCMVAALRQPRPGWRLLVLLALCIVLATMSKLQHVAFGVLLLFALLLAAWRCGVSPRLGWTVAVAALLGLALQGAQLQGDATRGISVANKTNALLGAVLGSSEDPARSAARLGLPPHCAAHAGKDFFSPGVAQQHPCPEVTQLSRLRLAVLVLREPGTLLRACARAAELARPWIPPHLGKVAGGVSQPLPASLWSIDLLLQRLPPWLWWTLLLVPPLLAAWQLQRDRDTVRNFLVAFLALYPPACLGIVVFGDGFADVAKQFHSGMLALLAFWLLALLQLARWCGQQLQRMWPGAASGDALQGVSVGPA